jgi:hypothetical protein
MKRLLHQAALGSSSYIKPYHKDEEKNTKAFEFNLSPAQFRLYQNFPQTFYKVTRVGFDLPKLIHVKLGVFDVFGREICILVDEILPCGSYEVVFDASHFNLEPGLLMYKLKAEEFVDTKKMFLLKNNSALA